MAISPCPDNFTDYITNLEEVFCCYICLGRLQDTRLCPKCSKMCCFQCIRRWLIEQKPSCPHCRCSLLLHELVKCRWVDDLLGQLKTSQAKKDALTKDQCAKHSEQLSVYCVTCGVCVCHQCALWAGEHANHDFQPVSEIYERHKKGLYNEIKNLKKRLAEILDSVSDIDRQLAAYNQERESHMKQISKVMKDISSRIDMQISSQITKLRSQQSILQKESDMVEQKVGEVLNKIETNVKSELIRSSPEILQELLGMSTQLAKPPSVLPTPLGKEMNITNELIPPYVDGEFIIEGFSPLRRRGSPIYSPPLSLHGQIWKLKVYPDGNGIFKGEFLSVFLELHSGFSGSAKYEYRVSMVHTSGNSDRTIYREFSSEFEPGECWGYNRFYRLEHLVSKGYVGTIDDNLKLQFSVRSPTFYHDSIQQQKQVVHLREQVEGMEERLMNQEDSGRGEELSESQLVVPENVPTIKNEGPEAMEGGDLTSEQLDRVLLYTPSDNSDNSDVVELAPASDDDQISTPFTHGEESDSFLTSHQLIPDSQESIDLMELNSRLQNMSGLLEGEVGVRDELDITLVSDATSDRAADSLALSNNLPTTADSYENSQDQEMDDASSSVGSEEGNDLSIHSLDSPLPETYWEYVPGTQLSEGTTPSDISGERETPLEENLTADTELNLAQDQFVFATRYTDSLSTNFPNLQASILACLRDVSNNPLLGMSPSSLHPTPPPGITPQDTATLDPATSSNPLDILPLMGGYHTASETEDDGQSYGLFSGDEKERRDSASDSLPPE